MSELFDKRNGGIPENEPCTCAQKVLVIIRLKKILELGSAWNYPCDAAAPRYSTVVDAEDSTYR